MDDQGYELLISNLNETKELSKKTAKGIARIELSLADLGAQRRLVALEEFRKKWEPIFYKVIGGGFAVIAIIDIAFKLFAK